MPDIYYDVDVALTAVPINKVPIVDVDGLTVDTGMVYNETGLSLEWNFCTTAGAFTHTAVTPTDTAGVYDFVNQGEGMYTIEIPASGGGTINNDTEGFGWFSGNCTANLPWTSPVYGFRAAALNNALIDGGDTLDVNVTAMAANVLTATAINADAITAAKIADNALANEHFAAGALTSAEITSSAGAAVTSWNGVALGTTNPLPNAAPAAAGGLIVSTLGTTDADDCLTATGFATPTNITAGTITTVTNLTNAPTNGDLTATMKTSVTTAATAATPIAASVTGNVGGIAGTITTLDALDTAQDTQHGTTQTAIGNLNDPTAAVIADAVWDELLTGGSHNISTSAGRRLRTLQTGGAYEGGAIWVDTINGTAGTVDDENGVVNLPVDTWADALTLSTSLGLKNFHIANGSTVTLTAASANYFIYGHEWTLALGSQSVASTMVVDAAVSGTGTGVDSEYEDCIFAITSLPAMQAYNCSFTATTSGGFTMSAAGDYRFVNCQSGVAGSGAPLFTLGTGAITAEFRRWSGGIAFAGITADDVITVGGEMGTIDLGSPSGAADIQIRGTYKAVTNVGSATVNYDGAIKAADVASIKTKTDSLTFTNAGEVDANTKSINDAEVIGDGNSTPWDGV